MATATFIIIKDQNEKDAASKIFGVGINRSPYGEGVKFTVTDWARARRQIFNDDGTEQEDNGKRYPVLVTNINGQENYIFLSTILATKPKADGGTISTDGPVNMEIDRICSEGTLKKKTQAQILQDCVDALKDKVIVVKRKPFVALSNRTETSEPRRYAASLVNLYYENSK